MRISKIAQKAKCRHAQEMLNIQLIHKRAPDISLGKDTG